MELWRLTGYDPAQRPDAVFFRRAIWEAAEVAYVEGWNWCPAPPDGVWSDETRADMARCGVSPFAE